jgi:hypothetical protein
MSDELNDMNAIRLALGLAAACAAWQSFAQYPLEFIPLRHSTVEQVLPALQPLLEPGATLTGQRGQLILRASPANVADIRLALETLDRPARRLQISVRFEDAMVASTQSVQTNARIGSDGSRIEVRARDAYGRNDERVDQRVQVVEGGRAFIATGQSRPIAQRQRIQTPGGVISQDTFVMQEASSGFEVVPRLAGDRVFLDLASQRERLAGSGAVQGQHLSSSTAARLGEWFELGGLSAGGIQNDGGIASASRSESTQMRRVWVKVEEIRN